MSILKAIFKFGSSLYIESHFLLSMIQKILYSFSQNQPSRTHTHTLLTFDLVASTDQSALGTLSQLVIVQLYSQLVMVQLQLVVQAIKIQLYTLCITSTNNFYLSAKNLDTYVEFVGCTYLVSIHVSILTWERVQVPGETHPDVVRNYLQWYVCYLAFFQAFSDQAYLSNQLNYVTLISICFGFSHLFYLTNLACSYSCICTCKTKSLCCHGSLCVPLSLQHHTHLS